MEHDKWCACEECMKRKRGDKDGVQDRKEEN